MQNVERCHKRVKTLTTALHVYLFKGAKCENGGDFNENRKIYLTLKDNTVSSGITF